MGSLTYDRVSVEFDDRTLLHLQIVIVQKLRRGESFLLSWRNANEMGGGRGSVWLHPAIPLYFKFTDAKPPAVNPAWLAQLSASASEETGLFVTSEDKVGTTGPSQLAAGPHFARDISSKDIGNATPN